MSGAAAIKRIARTRKQRSYYPDKTHNYQSQTTKVSLSETDLPALVCPGFMRWNLKRLEKSQKTQPYSLGSMAIHCVPNQTYPGDPKSALPRKWRTCFSGFLTGPSIRARRFQACIRPHKRFTPCTEPLQDKFVKHTSLPMGESGYADGDSEFDKTCVKATS